MFHSISILTTAAECRKLPGGSRAGSELLPMIASRCHQKRLQGERISAKRKKARSPYCELHLCNLLIPDSALATCLIFYPASASSCTAERDLIAAAVSAPSQLHCLVSALIAVVSTNESTARKMSCPLL